MTKEEFLNMVNQEIERIQLEKNIAHNKLIYWKHVEPYGKEYEDAKAKLEGINQYIKELKYRINFPAHARIQVMSDMEIEEYKAKATEEIEVTIKEIEGNINQKEIELSKYKTEEEELITNFSTMPAGEMTTEEILKTTQHGKEIRTSMEKCNKEIENLKSKLQEKRKYQEQIRAKTADEIKKLFLDKTKGMDDRPLSDDPYLNNSSDELLLAFASEPEKQQQVAQLLTSYRNLDDRQDKIKLDVELSPLLPRNIKRYLNELEVSHKIIDANLVTQRLQELEDDFNFDATQLISELSHEKIEELEDLKLEVVEDLTRLKSIIERHRKKISDTHFEELQILIAKKEQLTKRPFAIFNPQRQTKDETKERITVIDQKIHAESSNIYREILYWYGSKIGALGILPNYYGWVDGDGLEREKIIQGIEEAKEAIENLKKNINPAIDKMNQQNQEYKKQKQAIVQQIRNLGGENFKNAKIPYPYDSVQKNLDYIQSLTGIMGKIQQEAQNQADTKEAELRGISLEELKSMKAQLVQEKIESQSSEEEISSGRTK